MICPKCKSTQNKVLDSRSTQSSIRRRRQCESCQFRFTTLEAIKIFDLIITKRKGNREIFDQKKLECGIRKSFNKRNIDEIKINQLLQEIQEQIVQLDCDEISSLELGNIVLYELSKVDEAAFVCYWAMFGNFSTINDFEQLLSNYLQSKKLQTEKS
ncbi:MAG: transcriptional repressor NrdR [Candidatus Parcubacteria bacterium]|nr:transcriptional repressor NrdR [Candidatus Paceibacterota bacterium]